MSEAKFDSYTSSLEYLFRCGDPKAAEKHEEASNVRLIQNIVAAIGRDDLALVSEMLAEDVKLEIRGADKLPFIRYANGREQMLDAIIVNFSSLQNQKPVVESVIAQGDTVIVTMEEEGEVRATGKKYRIKCVQRFVIKDGKVALLEEQGTPVFGS
jgi:ketosteroid isomerase-like protein